VINSKASPPRQGVTFSRFRRWIPGMDRSNCWNHSLERGLQELPHSHRLAFAASCCERAYPNYVIFFQCAHRGDSAALRTSLNRVWDFIEGSARIVDDLVELEQKCESVTPDLDNFSTSDIDLQAAAAQEATFMVRLLLQFCRDNQLSYATRISTFARDTIDMYVQAVEKFDPADPQLDEKIAQHPLMLREVQEQESDLLKLTQMKTRADLQEFRRHATNLEQSNIGLMPQRQQG
jgi:uncharacterized protein YjaG (DUF416 family)